MTKWRYNKLRIIALGSVAVLFFPSTISHAATIDLQAHGTVYGLPFDADFVTINTLTSGEPGASAHSSLSNSVIVDGDVQASAYVANSSGDIVTGELKTSLVTSFTGYFALNNIAASAISKITETFIASGVGTVTAYLAFHGTYSLSSKPVVHPPSNEVLPEQNIIFALSSYLSLSSSNGTGGGGNTYDPANDCALAGGCTSASGIINDVLIANASVVDGSTLTLTAQLQSLIASAEGYIDLSQTGLLFLMTSEGVTLTPLDERFLANPSFNASPVPIPAALPLLAASLSAMGFMGWRKRRKAVAVA